jgi:PAS domain S-box-containing protein
VNPLEYNALEYQRMSEPPKFEAILEHTTEVVWLFDRARRRLIYINAAFERVWLRPSDEVLLASDTLAFLTSTFHPEDRDRFKALTQSQHFAPVDLRILRPLGEIRWVRIRLHSTDDNTILGFCEDITEFKRHEEQLEAHRLELEEAYSKLQEAVVTDPLTGLKNRRGLNSGLERFVMDAHRHSQPISAVAMDIDHFKTYNDTYGHPAGDTVLMAIATIIQRSLRPTDLAARVGGEEFLILLPDTDKEGAISAKRSSTLAGHIAP